MIKRVQYNLHNYSITVKDEISKESARGAYLKIRKFYKHGV